MVSNFSQPKSNLAPQRGGTMLLQSETTTIDTAWPQDLSPCTAVGSWCCCCQPKLTLWSPPANPPRWTGATRPKLATLVVEDVSSSNWPVCRLNWSAVYSPGPTFSSQNLLSSSFARGAYGTFGQIDVQIWTDCGLCSILFYGVKLFGFEMFQLF